uniref:Uncharacterized protein n=1 Tax=uncultured Alphaproteobacteria bacterium TaxID=91750 RepID=A0A6G8F2C9_9PROT|nr:hypothetical protein PlAlph_2950 [uncultured Alphaproteobacteria bacterium]
MYAVHQMIESLSDDITIYSGNEKEMVIDLIIELWTREIYFTRT